MQPAAESTHAANNAAQPTTSPPAGSSMKSVECRYLGRRHETTADVESQLSAHAQGTQLVMGPRPKSGVCGHVVNVRHDTSSGGRVKRCVAKGSHS